MPPQPWYFAFQTKYNGVIYAPGQTFPAVADSQSIKKYHLISSLTNAASQRKEELARDAYAADFCDAARIVRKYRKSFGTFRTLLLEEAHIIEKTEEFPEISRLEQYFLELSKMEGPDFFYEVETLPQYILT